MGVTLLFLALASHVVAQDFIFPFNTTAPVSFAETLQPGACIGIFEGSETNFTCPCATSETTGVFINCIPTNETAVEAFCAAIPLGGTNCGNEVCPTGVCDSISINGTYVVDSECEATDSLTTLGYSVASGCGCCGASDRFVPCTAVSGGAIGPLVCITEEIIAAGLTEGGTSNVCTLLCDDGTSDCLATASTSPVLSTSSNSSSSAGLSSSTDSSTDTSTLDLTLSTAGVSTTASTTGYSSTSPTPTSTDSSSTSSSTDGALSSVDNSTSTDVTSSSVVETLALVLPTDASCLVYKLNFDSSCCPATFVPMKLTSRRKAGLVRFRHGRRQNTLTKPSSTLAPITTSFSSDSSDSSSDPTTQTTTVTSYPQATGCAVRTIYPDVQCPVAPDLKEMRATVESVLKVYKRLGKSKVVVDCGTAGLYSY